MVMLLRPLAALVLVSAMATAVLGQWCPDGSCVVPYGPPVAVQRPPVLVQPAPAVVQPTIRLPAAAQQATVVVSGDGWRGRGVVVSWQGQPVVVTAAHVVRGARRPVVRLLGGVTAPLRVLFRDRTYDVAVLQFITPPPAQPAVYLAPQVPSPGQTLYDRSGNARRVLARSQPPGNTSPDWISVAGSAASGDSGGPMFDHTGRLAAIQWGSAGGATWATQVGRVHLVLKSGVRQGRPATTSPKPAIPAVVVPPPDPPPVQPQPDPLVQVNEQLAEILRRLAALEARKPLKGDQGEQGIQGMQGDKGDTGDSGTIDLSELPPIRIQTLKPDGTVHQDAIARLGDLIILKAVVAEEDAENASRHSNRRDPRSGEGE